MIWPVRLLWAAVPPFAAFVLQSMFWPAIRPYAWFLFYPAVFLSSWIGGLRGGLVATVTSTALAWWFFIAPERTLAKGRPGALLSAAVFMGMGVLFSLSHGRLRKANAQAAEALEAARHANERLETANDEITRLYEHTRELDELKSQFFANVSHELRTPLTLILGPVARRLAAADVTAEARRDLEIVERNARLLYRHVTDLLDVAKLEAGQMGVRYAEVDLGRLVRFVASHFEVLAGERRIAFTVEAPAELPAQVDAEKCQRVLLNLLSNAFKFTPEDGEVSLVLRAEGGVAAIQVRDNGPGVPAALRQAVFERFRQGDGGADRRHGGTGLGLAIVKDFVGLHGGSVTVADALGGGALFTVKLPLVAPENAEIQATPATLDEELGRQALDELRPAAGAGGGTGPVAPETAPLVLVVEDNPEMRDFVCAALGQHYRVVAAPDGQDGLEKALQVSPDLIVSDLMMPRMSGMQMVEALRDRRELDDVPIVILTAKADDELRVKLLREGVQDYLSKPFSVEEVLARVGGLVTKRRRTAEALGKSAERLQSTLDNMLEGGQIIGFDWRYLYVNDSAARHGRFRKEELLGRTMGEVYPGVEGTDVFAALRRCMDERTEGELENFFTYPDGSQSWFDLRIQPVPEGIFVLSIDITERKRAEEEVHRLNADLERRVAERTGELQAANQELDSFAYAVSHDLRAPLRAMSGFSQALIEDLGARLDGVSRGHLEQIIGASRRMGELIDGLLALSRSTRGELRRDVVDLSALAEAILGELRRADPERTVACEVESGLVAEGDPRMLEVVLRNLLGNAWKYTGGTPAAAIRFFAETEDGQRSFCVADNGAGFDMAHVGKLFQPFQRLHRQEEFPGIGIGLATAHRIVSRHGGVMQVEGTPHGGATVCFTLPPVHEDHEEVT